VDEGVRLVRPPHQDGVAKEPLLDVALDEDAEGLLQMDNFERVLARHVYCRCQERDGREGTAQLVHLRDTN